MFLAVNPNAGLDYLLFLDRVPISGTVRAGQKAWGMGGKALAAAWVLRTLGEPVKVIGFAGGWTGRHLEELLSSRGVECDFVWAEEESRLNVVLVARAHGYEVTIAAPGVHVRASAVAELCELVDRELPYASCLLLGGSLPAGCRPDLYAELIRKSREKGIPVVLDASGTPLKLGVKAGPTAVKPNRAEAEELSGRAIDSVDEAVSVAQELQPYGVRWSVITLGKRGLVGVGDGEKWHVVLPAIENPMTTVGAGDAVTAGLALGLSNLLPFRVALRRAVALAGAALCTPGTGDVSLALVEKLVHQVRMYRL